MINFRQQKMTTLKNKRLRPSHTPAMEKAISMASRRIGSWVVLISRRPLSGQQGFAWLHDAQLVDVGNQPVRLASYTGFASTAFGARLPL
jgi:hypothetical protein